MWFSRRLSQCRILSFPLRAVCQHSSWPKDPVILALWLVAMLQGGCIPSLHWIRFFLLCNSENVTAAVVITCQDQKFSTDTAVEVIEICQDCFHTETGNQGTQIIQYSTCKAEQQQTHGIYFDPHAFIIA